MLDYGIRLISQCAVQVKDLCIVFADTDIRLYFNASAFYLYDCGKNIDDVNLVEQWGNTLWIYNMYAV